MKQIQRVECSPFLKLVNMDVTRNDHVQHAVQYVRDNLPAGEQGKKTLFYLISTLIYDNICLFV